MTNISRIWITMLALAAPLFLLACEQLEPSEQRAVQAALSVGEGEGCCENCKCSSGEPCENCECENCKCGVHSHGDHVHGDHEHGDHEHGCCKAEGQDCCKAEGHGCCKAEGHGCCKAEGHGCCKAQGQACPMAAGGCPFAASGEARPCGRHARGGHEAAQAANPAF